MRFYTNVKLIGDHIYHRGYENGVEVKERIKYEPELYVPSNKKTNYLSLDDKYLTPIKFENTNKLRQFIDKYSDIDGFEYFGQANTTYQYISDVYSEEKIEFDIQNMKLYIIDIETTAEQGIIDAQSANEEILLITIQDNASGEIFTWGSRTFTNTIENHTYFECENEKDLLVKFLDFWTNNYPDVLTGWNCSGFDIPYIVNRICKIFGENEAKKLSIWKRLKSRSYILNGKTEIEYELFGITVLDYFQLFKKFAFINLENNRLDTVAKEILNESKLSHEEYESFRDFYSKNFNLFVEYNVQDCRLIPNLEKKLCLIQLAFTLAYQAKVNPEDVFSQGRMWDGIIYNYLKKDNIIIPAKKRAEEKKEKFKGAHVKSPQIGKFKYVCSLDLASLYPSLIRTYNISPETLVNEFNDYVSIDKIVNQEFLIKPDHINYTICANGSMYRKDKQGFLPKIMEKMFNERSVYKKKMLECQSLNEVNPSEQLSSEIIKYKNYQQALKICLNSAFGSLGNEYFRFYDIRQAEAITYSGQVVIKWIEKKLNSYLNKVAGTHDIDMILAMDTDSVTGDSIIRVNDKIIKISDFYDSISNNYLRNDTLNNNFVKAVSGHSTLSLSKEGVLENKNIKYVMKHKVKKTLYAIKIQNKCVVVTEDHSLIIKNKKTDEIKNIKPKDIHSNEHMLLYVLENEMGILNLFSDDTFEIENLGIQDDWVYDIEVEGNHNFFANDICVHNSCFLYFNPIIEKIFSNKIPEEVEVINFLTKVCDGILQEYIDKSFNELCEVTNAYQNSLHMKREKICSSALWRKKKNYILNVWDNEGVRYSTPKIKISGIEAIKTSTPVFCRETITEAIKIIMNGEENELIDYIKKVKSQFFKLSAEEVAIPKGISDMNKFHSSTNIYSKSTPIHTRGSLLLNHHLRRLKLTHKYSLITNGEKIKYCYLKIPNPIRENVISFIQTLPRELNLHNYIDYQMQFEKTFLVPIKSIIDIIGWNLEKKVNLANFYE